MPHSELIRRSCISSHMGTMGGEAGAERGADSRGKMAPGIKKKKKEKKRKGGKKKKRKRQRLGSALVHRGNRRLREAGPLVRDH